MILTFNISHNRDFSSELKKARQVTEFAVSNHTLPSKTSSIPVSAYPLLIFY
mgnify:CR=1 FL=1